jgi:hypothetical protein
VGAALARAAEAEGVPPDEARAMAAEVSAALKRSFAASITQIYSYAIWLVAAALALAAFALPEQPLRTSNRPEAAGPVTTKTRRREDAKA